MSLPVFGLSWALGFELLPRIRNWQDLIFYRPARTMRYQHIDRLFADDAVDWQLIDPASRTAELRGTQARPTGRGTTTTMNQRGQAGAPSTAWPPPGPAAAPAARNRS